MSKEPNKIDLLNVSEDLDSRSLNLYEKREKIYTRSIEGFYQIVRTFTGWPLLLGYFITPWLIVNDHQAILFDLPQRQFHIFWLTFWPQDFSLLAWALVISAFSLFFVTTLMGRVWCGYTCPQTVWTAIFMWAEQISEGERHQRINLDKAPWSLEKVYKRGLKHLLWIGFAALTGITFVGYFYGIKDLLVDGINLQLPIEAVFWTLLFTVGTYVNAGWMREQVCKYMCPYARFQAALFDRNTLLVSYDPRRGESRGPRKKYTSPEDLGDCIDCTLCVQVCPTGIDIRDGMQYECINCAACIDACNGIMDKMGYDRGLISYTTLDRLEGNSWSWKRPKLIGYALAIVVMVSVFTATLLTRIPLDIDVLRNRGQLYQEVSGGRVQNTYLVKVLNKDLLAHQFEVTVTGIDQIDWMPKKTVFVSGGKVGEWSINVTLDPDLLQRVNTDITFHVRQLDGDISAQTTSRFIGPPALGIGPSLLNNKKRGR